MFESLDSKEIEISREPSQNNHTLDAVPYAKPKEHKEIEKWAHSKKNLLSIYNSAIQNLNRAIEYRERQIEEDTKDIPIAIKLVDECLKTPLKMAEGATNLGLLSEANIIKVNSTGVKEIDNLPESESPAENLVNYANYRANKEIRLLERYEELYANAVEMRLEGKEISQKIIDNLEKMISIYRYKAVDYLRLGEYAQKNGTE